MEWYWWVAVAATWYIVAAVAVKRLGYNNWFLETHTPRDIPAEEREARIMTWLASPLVAAVWLVWQATVIIVGGGILWPLSKFFPWFDRVALQPKARSN